MEITTNSKPCWCRGCYKQIKKGEGFKIKFKERVFLCNDCIKLLAQEIKETIKKYENKF